MNPSSCAAVREALPWFVGGDLDKVHLDEVRDHLRDCVPCRREAAALQQGVARLARHRDVRPAAVDDDFFAAMHAGIVAQVEVAAAATGAPPAKGLGRGRLRSWLPLAAAAALLAFGFWLGHGGEPDLFVRPALHSTPTSLREPIVVPWSGPRFEMVPLGAEVEPVDGLEGGEPAGWMARSRLHDLVDEGMVLPRNR